MELDFSNAWWVVCLAVFIVVGVNAALYSLLSKQGGVSQIDMLRRSAQSARDPWSKENKDLEELSKRVAELQQKSELQQKRDPDSHDT